LLKLKRKQRKSWKKESHVSCQGRREGRGRGHVPSVTSPKEYDPFAMQMPHEAGMRWQKAHKTVSTCSRQITHGAKRSLKYDLLKGFRDTGILIQLIKIL